MYNIYIYNYSVKRTKLLKYDGWKLEDDPILLGWSLFTNLQLLKSSVAHLSRPRR